MKEMVKDLQLLGRTLPPMPEAGEIDEECGEKFYRGFSGNISQSDRWVTDGHILLAADAIDPEIAIERDEDNYGGKYATAARIAKVWASAESRVDVAADFIGVAGYYERGAVAFLRDTQGRVMIVNAYLLAFGVWAAHPDELTVDAAQIEATCLRRGQEPWFNTPLALRRDEKLVGLVMPMKLGADDYAHCDLRGEPINLSKVFAV